jgi:ADP-heptose:LPS heptosyltransferase
MKNTRSGIKCLVRTGRDGVSNRFRRRRQLESQKKTDPTAHSSLSRQSCWRLGLPLPKRIAVFRALKLGDLLCAVPALRALRAALPHARIVLISLPWAAEFVRRFATYLDEFCEFPGCPGLPEREVDPPRLRAFLAEMRAARWDLVLQLHGSGPVVNPLLRQFGARRLAGFFLNRDDRLDAKCFLPYPDHGLEIHRLLSLMEFLGIPSQGDHLEFPTSEEDERSLTAIPGIHDLPAAKIICVHPGASVPERRWPADCFRQVAERLAERGYSLVLTGTEAESVLTRQVNPETSPPALDLAGCTSLGALAALLRRARLLVCNDTGVSHLAAALGTPSVVISTGNNAARWAPTNRCLHRVLVRDSGVEPGAVLREIDALLSP